MASINLGGWHLPQKKTMAMGHTLNRSNTLPTIPIVLPKKKNMCLKALQKNSSLPPLHLFVVSFLKLIRLRPKVTQAQIGPSQFGSGDDTFHFTSFLLGATHGHPVTWLKPWEDSWIKNHVITRMDAVQCVHPWKLTWNPKTKVWKMKFLSKWVIFRFHVSFRGCIF